MSESATSPSPQLASTPQQSPSLLPTHRGKKMLYLFVALVVLLLFSGAYYLGVQSQPTAIPPFPPEASPVAVVQDDMTNWQTYSVAQLAFKYPTSWKLETNKKGMDAYLSPSNTSEEFPYIGIYVLDNPQNLTVKEYSDEARKDGPNPGLYSSLVGNQEIIAEEKSVSGIIGYYQKETGCEPLLCDKFAVSYNGKIYVAQVIYPGPRDNNVGMIFDQILSTFQFGYTACYQITNKKIGDIASIREYLAQEFNLTVADIDQLIASIPQVQIEGIQAITIPAQGEGEIKRVYVLPGEQPWYEVVIEWAGPTDGTVSEDCAQEETQIDARIKSLSFN